MTRAASKPVFQAFPLECGDELKQHSYTLFETPLGPCGIAWIELPSASPRYRITHLQLPEATLDLTEARISRACGAVERTEPPPEISNVGERILKHLRGDLQDFRDVAIDLSAVGPFVMKVCDLTREIPAGQTVTYGDIATKLGGPHLARAVGRALGANPIPLIVPCHRVMAAHGKPGGFSAPGGRATKASLLAIEGATVNLCLKLEAGS